MKLDIFSVKDLAAQAFGRPFYMPNKGLAIRSFTDEVNRPTHENGHQNDFFAHSEDFELYEIGGFDDSTGTIVAYEDPVLVVRAKEVKNPSLS